VGDACCALVLSSAIAASACGTPSGGGPFDGREVSLGTASDARRDLSACTAGECGKAAADSAELQDSDFDGCEFVDQEPFRLAWEQRFNDDDGNPGHLPNCPFERACTLQQLMGMVAASDRTLWFIALVVTPIDEPFDPRLGRGLVLLHHAWEGGLLQADTLDFEEFMPGEDVQYDATLASGRDGHVFVAVTKELSKEGWNDPQFSRFIEEYGADGARIGDRLALDGGRVGFDPFQLTPAGDGSIAVSSGDRLALINADRRLRWVQQQSEGITSITSDERHQVSTYAWNGAGLNRELVRHYDPLGRLSWQRGFSTEAEARLGTDARGNIVRLGIISSLGASPAGATELLIQILSAQGESTSGLRVTLPDVASRGFASPAIVDVTNTAWLNGASIGSEDGLPIVQRLYAIDLSSMTCAQHILEGETISIDGMAPIPGGGLYVSGYDGYGRIDL
jgi:hypothetical protein